jgi:hypothetical protein
VGGPPPPVLLRIQPRSRDFARGLGGLNKTGVSQEAWSNARDKVLYQTRSMHRLMFLANRSCADFVVMSSSRLRSENLSETRNP